VRQIFLSGHDFIVMAFLFLVGSPERSRAIVPQATMRRAARCFAAMIGAKKTVCGWATAPASPWASVHVSIMVFSASAIQNLKTVGAAGQLPRPIARLLTGVE
jgi:hypothetical protein